jgi:hypothetical protein
LNKDFDEKAVLRRLEAFDANQKHTYTVYFDSIGVLVDTLWQKRLIKK